MSASLAAGARRRARASSTRREGAASGGEVWRGSSSDVQLVVRESCLARHHLPVVSHKVGIVQFLVTAEQDWTVGREVIVRMQLMMQQVAAKVVDAGSPRVAVRRMQVLMGVFKVRLLGRRKAAVAGDRGGGLDASAVVFAPKRTRLFAQNAKGIVVELHADELSRYQGQIEQV